MRKWLLAMLIGLPLVLGGAIAALQAPTGASAASGSFTCPVNGEELPCPECCVLK